MATQLQRLEVAVHADNPETRLAAQLVGELALASRFGQQFHCLRVGLIERIPADDATAWAQSLLPALGQLPLRPLLRAVIRHGHQALWQATPAEAAMRLDFVPRADYELARARLMGDLEDRWWIALALATLIRAAQVNARTSHASHQWKLGKLEWIQLDRAFAEADAAVLPARVAALPKAEALGQALGALLPHALAELLVHDRGTTLVDTLLA